MLLQMCQLQKLDDYRWLVPRNTKPGMLTDALIYTDERLLQDLLKDLSLEQAINVAMLPGIVGRSLAMPDIHQGYGFPIGGVAATAPDEGGVISPGGVGFDIICGKFSTWRASSSPESLRRSASIRMKSWCSSIPARGGSGTRFVRITCEIWTRR